MSIANGYITEGSASVKFPQQGPQPDKQSSDPDAASGDPAVFYNKVQVVNRDLSIAIIQTFANVLAPKRKVHKHRGERGIRILEALSASGLRSIRYAKELTGVDYIIANDLDPGSVQCIRDNLASNNVPEGKVKPNCDDAIELMHRLARDAEKPPLYAKDRATGEFKELLQQQLMDVVDLDPYGTASPFLESAFECIEEGGLMCVTCTDSAVLCGKYPETAHAKYGSTTLNGDHCHEFGVRVLLSALERTANRHKRYIKPLVSLSINFYMRVFIQVYTQPAEVKLSVARLSYVSQCTRCRYFGMQPVGVAKERKKRNRGEDAPQGAPVEPSTKSPAIPPRSANFAVNSGTSTHGLHSKCPLCSSSLWLSGPIYNQPIHDGDFVEAVLQTVSSSEGTPRVLTAADRVTALLVSARDELPDVPLYYKLSQMCSTLGLCCPPLLEVCSALGRLGYRMSQTHCTHEGLKTDAPPEVLYGILRQRLLKEREQKGQDATVSSDFITTPALDCDFRPDEKFDIRCKASGVKKFLPNPEPDWGPKARHKPV
eukprot:PhM_4_TR12662/c0_g1_i1/m.74560/K00555/TRMT1, trm1; tRNA (guanine26-N2/guanine27-N2)-dimethyltransferase